MAIPIVPNLSLYSFDVPSGYMVLLPHSRHRTYFAIAHNETNRAADTYLWFGSQTLPTDVTKWCNIAAAASVNFQYGLAGPIWIATTGVGAGAVIVVSNLTESDDAQLLPQPS